MRVPWYETSAGATAALLFGGQWVDCDLYTIFTVGGPILQYCTGPANVTVPGGPGAALWSSRTVGFDQLGTKSVGHWKVGFDVDQWSVVVAPRNSDPITGATFPDLIGSVPWLQAAQAGALDGAEVQVDRAVFAAWPGANQVQISPVGVFTIFYGRVAEIDVGRSQCYMTVNSHLELLGNNMPRNTWQVSCIHNLFDAGCTLSAASFVVTGSVGVGSASNVILSSAAPPAHSSGTFALGRITMTSGLNQGFSRFVTDWTSGTFTLVSPMPFTMSTGDTFNAYPGCDKSFGTCSEFGVSGNTNNYGGVPFVPNPEVAV